MTLQKICLQCQSLFDILSGVKELDYLKVLNPEQLEAVCHLGSPLLILAGAGSGKTRVITTKIAWLIAEQGIMPEQILAVTFTNKAANEMRERAEMLEPSASRAMLRTFHSFGAWLLRRYGDRIGLTSSFTIYDEEDTVVLLMKAMPQLNKNEARFFAGKISRAKDYCIAPDNPLVKNIDNSLEFVKIYAAYEKRLRETGNVDFGDLIQLPVKLLKEDADVQKTLQNRFSVIMVDEYQDSNIAQFELLKALKGSATYLCVVGDDDQSIYRFRGAEVQNILTFADNFEHTKIIRLERNYRSYASILRTADSVVGKNTGRLGKKLIAVKGEGEKPHLFFLPNQETEAELCAELIEKNVSEGDTYSDWAILYRTNAQSLGFETAFLHRKIPYRVIGSLKFYDREEIKDTLAILALIANGRDEVSLRRMINKPPRGIGAVTQEKLITAARTLMFTAEENSFNFETDADFISAIKTLVPKLRLTKKAKTGVSEFIEIITELRKILEIGEGYFDEKDIQNKKIFTDSDSEENNGVSEITASALRAEGLAAFIMKLIEASGLQKFHQDQDEIMGTQKAANLQELANNAVLYPFSLQGLIDFLEHIELDRSLVNADDAKDSVNLITIHNTKGLEFRRVIITGLENGIFPRNAEDIFDLEEERRLMYVACTRAMDSLYLTSASMRRMYGKLSYMQPSIFLSEIDDDLIEISGEDFLNQNPYAVRTNSITKQENEWGVGKKVYHDDYGYGIIIQSKYVNENAVIVVQFETGYQMKFLPEYQRNVLVTIND